MELVHAGQSELAMPFRPKLPRKSRGLVEHCLMVQHDP